MTQPNSPYRGLPRRNFWSTGVRPQAANPLPDLFRPKFDLPLGTRIATAGSCFAQHIARHLARSGHSIINTEPAPAGWPDELARRYGYNIYSARYGNIYTARMLRQLIDEALNNASFADIVWQRGDRYHDAKRPNIEPDGFDSEAELWALRTAHVAAVRHMLRGCDLFIFTLGLTEGWQARDTGTAFAMAPGVVAGNHDPERHEFVNYRYGEILEDLTHVLACLRRANPQMKVLFTVSPVPLTATATQQHVLSATTYSKSVLRAVAGDLASQNDFVDYFPSYEIITGPYSRGAFFDQAAAAVTQKGVDTVMAQFSASYGLTEAPAPETSTAPATRDTEPDPEDAAEDVICEEILLASFADTADTAGKA